MSSSAKKRIFLVGAGVVSPGASDLKEFVQLIAAQRCALEPEPRLNNAFLVGRSKFDFQRYAPWIQERHAPAKFSQLQEKGGENVQLAVGTTIDALCSNPGLEDALKSLDQKVSVCFGSGFGDVYHSFLGCREFDAAKQTWDHFWADPSRNSAVRMHLSGEHKVENVPPAPQDFPQDSLERFQALLKWDAFWAMRSDALSEFVREFSAIEATPIGADVATDKLNVIRAKAKAKKQLQDKYKAPLPPWEAVNPTFLWNLPNGPAAQVTMLLGLHGVSSASFGACSTFGLVLKQALDGLRSGQYDAAILGSVDPKPEPAVVSAFSAAKVLAAGGDVGIPLCGLRGTHVSSGGCTWILMTEEAMKTYSLSPLAGIEILSVGMSSDAEHIITPSLEGPKHCIDLAIQDAGIQPTQIDSWDMHATGTPGDASEFKLIESYVRKNAVITARKGIFGHAMATCGGLELTAQLFGIVREGQKVSVLPSGIPEKDMHPTIRALGRNIAADAPVGVSLAKPGEMICGKLSMGIGGISSCVLTKVHLT